MPPKRRDRVGVVRLRRRLRGMKAFPAGCGRGTMSRMSDVIIGTNDGIVTAAGGTRELAGHEVTGLVARDGELWALLDRRTVWRGTDLASAEDTEAKCLLPTP